MISVILGLLGLGVIILVHEFGHFITARLCGVTVETFSIGMGPVLLRKKIGATEYRLSLIPLGGYCGMKGEKDFQKALDENLPQIPNESDSFYGVSAWKRLLIAFSGPFSNFLFAAVAFALIFMLPYSYQTTGNKIILANEVYENVFSSAAQSGLKTGDKIIAVNGVKTETFGDILSEVSVKPQETIIISVERNEKKYDFSVPVELDAATGAGRIGVISWIDPVIDSVEKKPATAGLEKDDLILAVDGIAITTTVDLQKTLAGKTIADLTVLRSNGNVETITVTPEYTKNGEMVLGLRFKGVTVNNKTYPFFTALIKGSQEAVSMLVLTVKSISLLFKGADFTQAVSGPVRITVMLGDAAKSGFSAGIAQGFATVFNFLALISISLFIMNLLPIPVLDGGLILFALIEIIRKKQIPPRVLYTVQFFGLACIIILAGIAFFSDFRYLFNR